MTLATSSSLRIDIYSGVNYLKEAHLKFMGFFPLKRNNQSTNKQTNSFSLSEWHNFFSCMDLEREPSVGRAQKLAWLVQKHLETQAGDLSSIQFDFILYSKGSFNIFFQLPPTNLAHIMWSDGWQTN